MKKRTPKIIRTIMMGLVLIAAFTGLGMTNAQETRPSYDASLIVRETGVHIPGSRWHKKEGSNQQWIAKAGEYTERDIAAVAMLMRKDANGSDLRQYDVFQDGIIDGADLQIIKTAVQNNGIKIEWWIEQDASNTSDLERVAYICKYPDATSNQELNKQAAQAYIYRTSFCSALYGPYELVNVVDGDTIQIQLHQNTLASHVELAGIDAPPVRSSAFTDLGGTEAKKHLTELVEGHTLVFLEYDIQDESIGYEKIAHVYLHNESMSLSERMLYDGYAKTYFPTSIAVHKSLYRNLEQSAKTNQRGLWYQHTNFTYSFKTSDVAYTKGSDL